MNKYRVTWDDFQDDYSHSAIFEAPREATPTEAARAYLDNLGDLAEYGYWIESISLVEPKPRSFDTGSANR